MWRERASKDCRKKADKSPLRSLWSLSFLSNSHGGGGEADQYTHGYLHDAQISCVVTGHNNSMWTAWALADTYFHDENDGENNKEMLAYYNDPDERGDPLTRGKLTVDTPLWDPREYFLVVYKMRLMQITKEWRAIIYMMKSSVENYVRRHSIPLFKIHTVGPQWLWYCVVENRKPTALTWYTRPKTRT